MASPTLPMFNQNQVAQSDLMANSGQLFNATPGSNQHMSANPAAAVVPGNVPTTSGASPSAPGSTVPYKAWSPTSTQVPIGSEQNLGGSNYTVPTLDPQMTQQMMAWLQGQIGTGLPGFSGSTALPTGGSTAPGALSAPLNSVDQSLMDFYNTGKGGTPGMQTLASQAAGIDATPQWQAMIAAMNGPQGPEAQQYAQLAQQFGSEGAIGSSPYAQAVTQYGEQNVLNQNALLASLTQQNMQLSQSAADTLQSGAQSFGSSMQTLDNNAIQQQLTQFLADLPQNSPLLGMLFSGATSSPSAIGQKSSVGGAQAAAGAAGSALQGIADLYSALDPNSGGGGSNG